MKVRIDSGLCQVHSLCCMSAPEIFDIGDDGVTAVTKQPTTEAERDAARYAAMSCPEQAIICEQ